MTSLLQILATAHALGDPTRLRMFAQLARPRTVGQLAACVGVTSAAVSYHLRLMRDAGLVVLQREGRYTIVRRDERRWAAVGAAFGEEV